MKVLRWLPLVVLMMLTISPMTAQQAPLTQDRVSARLRELFPDSSNANKDIAEALQAAAKDHKRVLVVFGASWCFDCFALDYRFHQPNIQPLVESNYHVVHVDIGQHDKNLDIAKRYNTPVEAIPAVAVLSSSGKLLHSQKSHEFSSARSLDPQQIVSFLEAWKPKA